MNNCDDDSEASGAAPLNLQSEAERGNADAQFALAFLFAAGSERQDYAQALAWYLKAAEQNHLLAQFNLGQMFSLGQGMPKCDSTAAKWIRRAANGGDAGAQFNLGKRCSQTGVAGSERDAMEARVESYKWFTLSAAQSYHHAVESSDAAKLMMKDAEITEGDRRVAAFVKS